MLAIIFIGVFFFLIFWFFPEIDIWFSSLFYDHVSMSFPYNERAITEFIYESVNIFTVTIVSLLIANIIGKILQDKTRLVNKSKKILPHRYALYLLLLLALGPGLMVHQGFKEFLDRPRPKHITEFGGTEFYARPFTITVSDKEINSFVSGHAAVGFYIASIALLLKNRRKKIVVYGSGILVGILVGLGRIAQGKHFLSDIIFSAVFTLLLAHIIYYFMFKKDRSGLKRSL